MTENNISDAAVDAAVGAHCEGTMRAALEAALPFLLEAAPPHMLAGVISKINDQVWRLENTLVDECDYPSLCAQREALIGVIQMLQEAAP